MVGSDVERVVAIEEMAYGYPWSMGVFMDCIRVGYSCWVMSLGDRVQGYGIMSIAAGESHILNLCVSPRVQGRGNGVAMLRHLCRTAMSHRARETYLEVRPSNHAAIRLYEGHGFQRVGTRKGYYPDAGNREDAFVYSLSLEPHGDAYWLSASD
jgi:ribosomal-protein-alanine N-acetyltransferase